MHIHLLSVLPIAFLVFQVQSDLWLIVSGFCSAPSSVVAFALYTNMKQNKCGRKWILKNDDSSGDNVHAHKIIEKSGGHQVC